MRERLPDRRFSVTVRVPWVKANLDDSTRLQVTIGLDLETLCAKEVFCADFKAGTDQHVLITDACILVSRCLQHGDTPDELYASLAHQPSSIIGTLLKAVLEEQLLQQAAAGLATMRESSLAQDAMAAAPAVNTHQEAP